MQWCMCKMLTDCRGGKKLTKWKRKKSEIVFCLIERTSVTFFYKLFYIHVIMSRYVYILHFMSMMRSMLKRYQR